MKVFYYKIRAVAVKLLLRFLPRNQSVVYAGRGSSLELCHQMSLLGHRKALLVTDSFLDGSGLLDPIKDTLRKNQLEFAVYDGVMPDPEFEQVQAGEALLRAENCDSVLAVGGGSVLDAAKMIALLHRNPGDLAFFDGIQKAKHPGLPVFAVPTTAGTGSETTPASVITDSRTHRKVAVADGKLVPHFVALDAELTRTMPAHITAATGMDALTHAVESYLSKAATPTTREMAAGATRTILEYLPRAWRDGNDMDAREAMLTAAFHAGVAFGRTSVGYAHAIAHQLGRVCGTPHGEANAMVLPEVLAAYGESLHGRLAALARETGLDASIDTAAATALIDRITELRDELQMPTRPAGLKSGDIAAMVKAAESEAGDIYPVPRYLSRKEIQHIVEGLLH